ncbi:MAG: hypothetical protein QOH38_1737 [Thermoleophilaceae bacterium]|nr:hypothetical protein [Thermoleophilaceae bacterium]
MGDLLGRSWLVRRAGAARLLTGTAAGLVLAIGLGAGTGAAQTRGPSYEPNFAADLTAPRPCALDTRDPYERAGYQQEGWKGPDYVRYPGACQRLRFAYGPLAVTPGQNDVLVGPVTIEKPNRPGYITRIRPNLMRADGTVPPVEQVHLHHGTWLSQPTYGSGPFFAAGEEKTIGSFPRGYGMPVKATDTWQLLYMVHSAVEQPMEVFITYDVDFIPREKAAGIKPVYPVWLDVRPSGYPVFNVQRRFGGSDSKCTWPKQNCANFDPYGNKIPGQGQPANGKGEDLKLPERGQSLGAIKNFTGGTLIVIGGHLHPSGIQNEIDLVRGAKKTRIYDGRAHYWSRRDSSKDGGPPDSWDFSMEVDSLPRWGVHVKPGDALRSNATYDTSKVASYEDMGIAVTAIAPDTPAGKPTAPGVDPFRARRDRTPNCRSGGVRAGQLCTVGRVSHGHYKENGHYGGHAGHWTLSTGGPTNNVGIVDFTYQPGDLSAGRPIPSVKLGTKLSFTNFEGAGIYHTVTSCAFPCLGETGAAFPLSDGRTSTGRKLDVDSAELGYGAPYVGAASQTISWQVPVTGATGFKPGEKVTYFCRVHPFMRGAFEVSK